MKLNNEETIVEANGVAETSDFSIKTNPAAFQLLSSGLYSNKIRAVIRELACNAVDAHAMVGNQTQPIEVKLPNDLDTQFYVKDFGPGLSHDQVMRLYTTYFDSTKRDSNDFIGGFGVGSKSPFAYTDSFTVESRQAGKVRTYTAFVDEGFPKIAFMAEEPTDEPSGLTVRFPVKPNDFARFASEANEVFQWFVSKPTVLGVAGDIPSLDYVRLSETVSVPPYFRKASTSGANEAMVRMGNVVYPLAKFFNQLDYSDPDHAVFDWVRSRRVLLEAPIGSISVAASREELAYDKPTLATLRRLLGEAYRLALADVVSTVSKLDPTQWTQRKQGYELLQATGLTSLWTKKALAENESNTRSYKQATPLLNRALAEHNLDPDQFIPFLNASRPPDMTGYTTLTLKVAHRARAVHDWDNLMGSAEGFHSGVGMPEPHRELSVFVDDVPVKSAWAKKAWKTWKAKHIPPTNSHMRYTFVIVPREGLETSAEFAAEKEQLLAALGNPPELPPLSSGLADNERLAMQGRAERSFCGSTFFTNRPSRVYEGTPFLWIGCTRHGNPVVPDYLTEAQKETFSALARALLSKNTTHEADPATRAFFKLLGITSSRIYRVAPDDIPLVSSMKGAKSLVDTCVAALQKPQTLDALSALELEVDVGDVDKVRNPLVAMLYYGDWGVGKNLNEATDGTRLGELAAKLRRFKLRHSSSVQSETLRLITLVNEHAETPVQLPQRVFQVDSGKLFKQNYPLLLNLSQNFGASDIDHVRDYIKWCEEKMAKDSVLNSTLDML